MHHSGMFPQGRLVPDSKDFLPRRRKHFGTRLCWQVQCFLRQKYVYIDGKRSSFCKDNDYIKNRDHVCINLF